MGFWKDVLCDMQEGMTKEQAIELNAKLRYGNLSEEERRKAVAIADADIVINSMK